MWFQVNRDIGLLFDERLDTILRHRNKKYPDLLGDTLSDSLRIYFISTLEHRGDEMPE